MKRTSQPSAEDIQLFQEAVGPVRRINHRTETLTTTRVTPEPKQSRRDEAQVRSELLNSPIDPAEMEIGEELSYLKSGMPANLLRQLRRGQFSIVADLDLHQMTANVARVAIKQFLDDCRRHNELCVKIIHGKGLRSKQEGPVLKRLTDRLLQQRADVLAYASARPSQGGTGAVVVLLRRK